MSTAQPLSNSTNTPVDPKQIKKAEKAIARDAKADEKTLKQAEKTAAAQAKAEVKSLKEQSKAQKALAKATAKEQKYAKGLARQQQKYDGAVSVLNKAKEHLRISTEKHNALVQSKTNAAANLEHTQHVKAEHDAEREASRQAIAHAPTA